MVFQVPGKPVGKGRPRFSTNSGTPRAYTPDKTVQYEKKVRAAYLLANGPYFDGPVRLKITAYFKIPKGISRNLRTLMAEGEIRPTQRPDADNIIKSIMDALNGVAYKDDASVAEVACSKRYTGSDPYALVEITEIEGR